MLCAYTVETACFIWFKSIHSFLNISCGEGGVQKDTTILTLVKFINFLIYGNKVFIVVRYVGMANVHYYATSITVVLYVY